MRLLEELIAELCPDGVPYKTLGQVGEFIRGKGLQKKDLTDSGTPAIHYGQVFTTYDTETRETLSFVDVTLGTTLRLAKTGDLVVATTSENDTDVCKAIAWLGVGEAAVSSDAFIYHHTLDPMFAAYLFQTHDFDMQKRKYISGTKVKRVSGTDLAKILVPVPPLEVQREVARVLDAFRKLEAELEAELEARKLQYEHYRRKLVYELHASGTPMRPLGDLVEFCKGRPLVEAARVPGPYPVVSAGRTAAFHHSDFTHKGPAVTVASHGDAGFVNYWSGPIWLGNNVFLLTPKSGIQPEFLHHVLKAKEQELQSKARGGGVPYFNSADIAGVQLPVPSPEVQRKVAQTLAAFAALVGDLTAGLPAEITARRKQYEHYRERLLTFKELGA